MGTNFGWVSPPRAPIDGLIRELLSRGEVVDDGEARLRGLLDAVVGIATDLDLPAVLRRVVQAACHLVDACYGTLGVVGPDGETVVDLVQVGADERVTRGLGASPPVREMFDRLIADPRPLRLRAVADPFPGLPGLTEGAGRRAFLGVPVALRGEVFGVLCLVEKRGGATFTREDEDLVVALTAAAGVAVENARLYESGRRRQRILETATHLATGLLRGMGRTEALEQVAASARALCGADLGTVVVPDPVERDLRVLAADGPFAAEVLRARISRRHSVCATVLASGKPELVPDAQADPRIGVTAGSVRWGPVLVVPLRSNSEVLGVLLVARQAGGKPFDADDVEATTGFAAQAVLALEMARSREDRERLALLEDRDRIARDLHDRVIQRLFATGLGMQGAARVVDDPAVAERLSSYVAALDDTIREIRQAIFELRCADERSESLRHEVLEVLYEATEVLGFEPAVRFDGPVDTLAPPGVIPQVAAVLREALTNVGKHSAASEAEVTLAVTPTTIRLTIRDDGIGLPEQRRESGLSNLCRRAEDLGGWLDARSVLPHGTELVWQVPLARAT